MTLVLNTALKTKLLDMMFNGGAGVSLFNNGTLRMYWGIEGDIDDPPSGSLTVSIDLPADAMAAAAAGSIAKSGVWMGIAGDTQSPNYFRITSGDGLYWMDGSIGAVGSGEDIELDDTSITIGQAVTISTCTLTFP